MLVGLGGPPKPGGGRCGPLFIKLPPPFGEGGPIVCDRPGGGNGLANGSRPVVGVNKSGLNGDGGPANDCCVGVSGPPGPNPNVACVGVRPNSKSVIVRVRRTPGPLRRYASRAASLSAMLSRAADRIPILSCCSSSSSPILPSSAPPAPLPPSPMIPPAPISNRRVCRRIALRSRPIAPPGRNELPSPPPPPTRRRSRPSPSSSVRAVRTTSSPGSPNTPRQARRRTQAPHIQDTRDGSAHRRGP
ncbi:hypothetical protein BKA62DRAFT_739787, partial [Auriculariales sp. MPI-PUGE-AT-0066]